VRTARARGVVGGDARAGAIESLVKWTVGRDRNMRLVVRSFVSFVRARVEMA
jgi:hypothetical protein